MLFFLMALDTPESRRIFEKIYKACRQMMYHAAYELVQDEMDAEDVVHEAFMKVVKNFDRIDKEDENRLHSYLLTITRNCAIDYLRRKKSRRTEYVGGAAELEAYQEYATGPEEKDAVIDAILHLPLLYQTVFSLKYHHGYSNKEIAKMLDITEVNVRKRIQRGKTLLEKQLNPENGPRE